MSLLDSMLNNFKGINAKEIEIPLGNVVLYTYPINAYDEFWISKKINAGRSEANDLSNITINYMVSVCTLSIATMYISASEKSDRILITEDLGVPTGFDEINENGEVQPFSEWSRKVREACADKLLEKLIHLPTRFIDNAYQYYNSEYLNIEFDLNVDRMDSAIKHMVEQNQIDPAKEPEPEKESILDSDPEKEEKPIFKPYKEKEPEQTKTEKTDNKDEKQSSIPAQLKNIPQFKNMRRVN